MRCELIFLDGSGRRFPLPFAGEVLVGSAAECAIRLTAPDVSRRHALLTVRRGSISILDLDSKNGTFVAGQRVKEALLKAGDLVRFSSVLAQVMPLASSSEEGREEERGQQTQSHRQLSPTGEVPVVEDTFGVGWLLARWAREGGSATAAALEWIVQTADARGAAILRFEATEQVVVAASGEVEAVLASPTLLPALSEMVLRAGVFETVAMDDEAGEILAVKCTETSWLLLVVKAAKPTVRQIELFVRAVAVAHRLDH